MIASRICVVFVGLNAAACFSPAAADVPTFATPGVRAVLLVFSSPPPTASRLVAIDPESPELPLTVLSAAEETSFIALGIAAPLVEIGMRPGEVELAIQDASRPLPQPLARLRYDWDRRGWQDEAPDLMGLEVVRLPVEDPNTCYAAGRCPSDAFCLDACPALGTLIPPEPPRPPRPLEWACPPGWVAFGDPGEVGCAERGSTCEPGLVRLPGDDGCRPLGEGCPRPGTFGADRGRGKRTIFVRAGGHGDGSERAPFGELSLALSSVVAGETVAVVGNLVEERALRVPAGVRLSGACAAKSRIELPGIELEDGAALEDLTIAGRVDLVASATVVAIRINGWGQKSGLHVPAGGRLIGRRLSIGGPQVGIALYGATASLDQIEIHDVTEGVLADSSVLVARDLRIERAWLYGLYSTSSRFNGRRIGIRSPGAAGVVAAGGSTDISELSIEDGSSVGVFAASVPRFHLDRAYIARTDGAAIYALGTSHLELNDLRFETEGAVGHGRGGLSLGDGVVDATVDRLVAIGTEDLVAVNGTGDRLMVRDLVARGGVGDNGALGCFDGDELVVERARIEGGIGYGISAYLCHRARLEDVDVSDRRRVLGDDGEPIPGRYADGIGSHTTRPFEVRRTRIRNVQGGSINVRDSEVVGSDIDLDGTITGFEAAGDTTIDLDRLRITQFENGGIEFRGIALDLEDVEIRGTRVKIPDARGFAIRSDLPIEPMRVRRLLIENAGDVGLYVEPMGDLITFADRAEGGAFINGAVVRGQPIGLGVVDQAESRTRLFREIDLRGNDVAIAEVLP